MPTGGYPGDVRAREIGTRMTRQALQQVFDEQRLANGYELVDGVAMHAENGKRFQIPHPVLKKHIDIGQFVELRIDSPRFSVHEVAPEKCTCPTCNGEITKPILSHEHPATLLPLPTQNVPSRGWGEDFWVRVIEREDDFFKGIVDNPLYETPGSRLHTRQTARTRSDGNGLDQLASPPVRDQGRAIRRS